jgi:hypothetical protein
MDIKKYVEMTAGKHLSQQESINDLLIMLSDAYCRGWDKCNDTHKRLRGAKHKAMMNDINGCLITHDEEKEYYQGFIEHMYDLFNQEVDKLETNKEVKAKIRANIIDAMLVNFRNVYTNWIPMSI